MVVIAAADPFCEAFEHGLDEDVSAGDADHVVGVEESERSDSARHGHFKVHI